MENPPKVGELITNGDRRRDAIHVAVAPVTASEKLAPGDSVWFDPPGQIERVSYTVMLDEIIGIVDPFLTKQVDPGQRFWLFLKPNTVTSLRHVWTHPAFVPKVPEGSC